MQALAEVGAALGPDGRSRLTRLSGAPPLVPRATGRSAVHLVGAAGGPFPGDRTRLELTVAAGAVLVVGSAAATVALPGADPTLPASRHELEARVGAGGLLVVIGQPLVASRGSRHRVHAEVELDEGARLVWRDLLVPGRSGERTGELSTRLRVTRLGAPLLDAELSAGSLGDARCAGTLAVFGVDLVQTRRYGPDAALMPLAAGGVLGTALGAAHEVERVLARMATDLLDADLLAHL